MSDPSPAGTGSGRTYKWAVVAMLWTVCVVNYADRQSFSAVFPSLKAEFGFDPVELGLLGSAFAWIYAFGSPIAGYIADRIRRKDMILGACVFWSVVTALTGLCSRLWSFVGVRALTGMGETLYFPAAVSMLGDYHDRRSRSLALSIHQSGVYVGSIAGSWLGAWLAERVGWRVGFYFFGGLGIVLALVLGRVLKEPARERTREIETAPLSVRATLAMLLNSPTALILMGVFAGANFVATVFLAWTPTFLVEKFHFGLSSAGLSGSAYINAASALSVPLGGYLADRLARRAVGGRILVQAAGLLCGAAFVAIVGLATTLPWLLGSMLAVGLCKGVYDSNIFAALCDFVEPRARASATGVMNTVGWAGGALGPLAVGIATKYGRHGSDTVANMSEAIAFGSLIYAMGGTALLWAGLRSARREATALSIRAGSA